MKYRAHKLKKKSKKRGVTKLLLPKPASSKEYLKKLAEHLVPKK
jgi:hypothetical protein